jgi:hypothetical protein
MWRVSRGPEVKGLWMTTNESAELVVGRTR